MTKKMYPAIHFEMPAKDNDRVRKFYESVFGWQITQLSPDMEDFLLAFTTETDERDRMPKRLGAINGGFYKRTKADQQTKITILVDDIREVLKRIKAAGGKLVEGDQGELDEVPGVGLFATFMDTEGNVVTIYEDRSPNPTPNQQALLGGKPAKKDGNRGRT
jgi:predicted enzyme related to lactoylglutathione lyase